MIGVGGGARLGVDTTVEGLIILKAPEDPDLRGDGEGGTGVEEPE